MVSISPLETWNEGQLRVVSESIVDISLRKLIALQ